jgi:hypothetical protein
MNTKIKFLILGIAILIVIGGYLISQKEIEPPPAILKIDGKEQISGIGSYCWMGTWKALCVDMIGIPTAQEPLLASSPFTAHLRLPLQEPPYELRLNVVRVKDEDELNFSARGWRWWNIWSLQGKRFISPLERESDIGLSLEPGLYVLSIEAWWEEKGSASYGFLVEVQASRTNPEPFGNPVTYKDMEVTVLEVEKMEQIVTRGNGEGIYGYMPDGGGYFLIITIKVKNIGHPDNAVYYSTRQFKVVGSKGKTYPFGGDPLDADRNLKFIGGNELFEGEVYGGDAITGRVLRPVDSNDSNLTLRWEADNGVFRYLSLNIPIEMPTPIITPAITPTPAPFQPDRWGKPVITSIKPDAGTIGTKVVITGTGFTARDNNVAFRLAPEDAPTAGYKVGYINNLISRDGKTIEFVIPEVLGACAFPLPETIPVTACPLIGILFKSGTQTYPVFVVNQNGTSNSVNFTVSR